MRVEWFEGITPVKTMGHSTGKADDLFPFCSPFRHCLPLFTNEVERAREGLA